MCVKQKNVDALMRDMYDYIHVVHVLEMPIGVGVGGMASGRWGPALPRFPRFESPLFFLLLLVSDITNGQILLHTVDIFETPLDGWEVGAWDGQWPVGGGVAEVPEVRLAPVFCCC
jgi:hypothetical protein